MLNVVATIRRNAIGVVVPPPFKVKAYCRIVPSGDTSGEMAGALALAGSSASICCRRSATDCRARLMSAF